MATVMSTFFKYAYTATGELQTAMGYLGDTISTSPVHYWSRLRLFLRYGWQSQDGVRWQ